MEITRLDINEAGMRELITGPVRRHLEGLADRVVNQAIINASGRPGPRIRTGDLVESVQKAEGTDGDEPFFDVGATAEHRGYPYPSRLETGQDGVRYQWLLPALEQVIAEAQ